MIFVSTRRLHKHLRSPFVLPMETYHPSLVLSIGNILPFTCTVYGNIFFKHITLHLHCLWEHILHLYCLWYHILYLYCLREHILNILSEAILHFIHNWLNKGGKVLYLQRKVIYIVYENILYMSFQVVE